MLARRRPRRGEARLGGCQPQVRARRRRARRRRPRPRPRPPPGGSPRGPRPAGVGVDGFALQPMIRRPDALELILGIGRDPVFGPVLLFGTGGLAVDLFEDTAVALPPLDAALAAALVARTRAGAPARRIPRPAAGGRRGAPSRHWSRCRTWSRTSPASARSTSTRSSPTPTGVLALDAQMMIDPADIDRPAPNPDLAIRPYPAGWRAHPRPAADVAIRLRPIRAGRRASLPRLPRAHRRRRTSGCASWRRASTSPRRWRCA